MVVVVPPPPTLNPDVVELFYVVDELLARSPILVFYGPSATPTAAASNSRVQAHVFSPAGLQSYPRLTISPSSPLYSAVNCLPREEQGDEICRGLAFSLCKYFAELPQAVKTVWENEPSALGKLRSAPTLFSDSHAAILASRMVRVDNVAQVIKDVCQALADQSVSWLDLDVMLPVGSFCDLSKAVRDSSSSDLAAEDVDALRYGDYAPMVRLFGDSAFLPTSRLRRAPSRPTALNRTASFARKQKEALRREMCELLDTEENYVSKLYDLIHSVAADFREKAKGKGPSSSSPSEEALKGLFPNSLDRILETNSAFLEDLRKLVEDTENDAIQDIEATTEENAASWASRPDVNDVTGAMALASCFRAWFPKFADCYVDYMQAHSQFSQFLKVFMKETGSSFSKRLQETGEQRLMSMLIEPVQRLPRYNLYIDNILKQLPAKHPALKIILSARDVISEICTQDSSAIPQSSVIDHLRKLIPTWPHTFRPSGRLVNAVDVVELAPPYLPDISSPRAVSGILLLFTDYVVILRKGSKTSLSARGLMAQVDGQDVANTEAKTDDLLFRQALELNAFDATELDGGKTIRIIPTRSTPKQPLYGRPGSRPGSATSDPVVQVFHLTGAHEGKASRIVEDLVKARVEGRFSEEERESYRWEARSASGVDLTFFVAVSEASVATVPDERGLWAKIRVNVDLDEKSISPHPPPPPTGLDVRASLARIREDFYCLQISGPNGFSTKDNLTAAEFLPVLSKRLSNVLQMKHQIKNSKMTRILLLRNQHILQSLKIVTENLIQTPKDRPRPHSPVKMLSNLFGGSVSKDGSFRRPHQPTMSLTEIPQLPRPRSPRRASNESPKRASVATQVTHSASSRLEKLEDTLATFVIALHARKGNIVGRTLRSRMTTADELAINELYNTLLEEPGSFQLAAQAHVDVLFSAFEKFVKIAWQDKMGPVISRSTWSAIQSKLDCLYPGDFEEFFRAKFGEMSPQNQRALKAIVKLLADLLEGTGNDGDRGILTASFAEVLVPEGNPHEFVSVLDRLVEDIEALLVQEGPNAGGSMNSESRHRVNNTGSITSITSNASSIRKKFGFGALTRKGSKADSGQESDSVSVWRALSKSKHGSDSQPSSWSKASLGRSNSTDFGVRLGISPKRPVSRDRPTVLGAFVDSAVTLSTIGEGQASGPPPRKKRRSSLSDLISLQNSAANTPTFLTPRTPNRGDSTQRNSYFSPYANAESPRTPSPTKQSLIPAPTTSNPAALRANSPTRRENSPVRVLPRGLTPSKSRPTTASSEEVTITSHSPLRNRKNTGSVSNIPTLKTATSTGGLSERPTSGNVRKLPPPPTADDKPPSIEKIAPLNPAASKLRMQSPQKLRERLQTEQGAGQTGEASLQAELTKIGEEIASLGRSNTRSGVTGRNLTSGATSTSLTDDSDGIKALQTKLAAITSKQSTASSSMTTRLDALAADIASSLQVSEARVKKLDELYREANAENEALYSRFNEELVRVMGRVRVGEGETEMRKRMKELEDESGRLRRENGRLRREVVGLRAQLRE